MTINNNCKKLFYGIFRWAIASVMNTTVKSGINNKLSLDRSVPTECECVRADELIHCGRSNVANNCIRKYFSKCK